MNILIIIIGITFLAMHISMFCLLLILNKENFLHKQHLDAYGKLLVNFENEMLIYKSVIDNVLERQLAHEKSPHNDTNIVF